MTEHVHEDPTALQFACPACVERMKEDQRLADLAEAGEPQLDLDDTPPVQPSLLDAT